MHYLCVLCDVLYVIRKDTEVLLEACKTRVVRSVNSVRLDLQ